MEWNCGNSIAEVSEIFFLAIVAMSLPKIGGGKNGMELWQWYCRNRWKFFLAIMAMPLLKMGGKKKIVVAEIWGGIQKKCVTFTVFLQYFHNKSKVISYY